MPTTIAAAPAASQEEFALAFLMPRLIDRAALRRRLYAIPSNSMTLPLTLGVSRILPMAQIVNGGISRVNVSRVGDLTFITSSCAVSEQGPGRLGCHPEPPEPGVAKRRKRRRTAKDLKLPKLR
jgi:hypothetical protein